jgi:hypothetical protein
LAGVPCAPGDAEDGVGGFFGAAAGAMKVFLMSKFLVLVLGVLLQSLFVSCQRNNWLLGDEFQRSIVLKVQSVDSTTYSNYYDLSFRNKQGKPGNILVDKKHGTLPGYLHPKTGFQTLLLGDVIEFKFNGDDVAFRGHAMGSDFYIDGELCIDLSSSAKRPYYRIIEKKE